MTSPTVEVSPPVEEGVLLETAGDQTAPEDHANEDSQLQSLSEPTATFSELEENKKNAATTAVATRASSRGAKPSRHPTRTPDHMREPTKAVVGRKAPPSSRTPRPGERKVPSLYTGRLNPSFGAKDWESSLLSTTVPYEELNYLPSPTALPESTDLIAADVASRMLKAKVDVLQDELQRMIHECLDKEERIRALDSRLKDLEHEKMKLQRDLTVKQQQADRGQRLAEEARSRADNLELQCVGLRKELEVLRAGQKQFTATKGTAESRLNRALEELERCKLELKQAKTSAKELSDVDKKRLEDLVAENKNLEKQKTELLLAFKKQLKLIDILKKQKMHLEVAKVLQFTEEEFMKALDWGT